MNKEPLSFLLVVLLGSGMVFAWYALGEQISAYYAAGNSFVAPIHPVLTPCFYGSCAFVVAFVWALVLWRTQGTSHVWMFRFLVFCTIFAAVVVAYESLIYAHVIPSLPFNCAPGVHPLNTACFTGMLFFMVSAACSYSLYRYEKNNVV